MAGSTAIALDMGGGKKVLLKEIDAPIILSGRHWGNMRCAFVPRESQPERAA